MIGTRISIECTPALLYWLSSVCDESFADDMSPNLQTFLHLYEQELTMLLSIKSKQHKLLLQRRAFAHYAQTLPI